MKTHKVSLPEGFLDGRGKILPIVDDFANVQVIHSNKGAVRANHYHKTDSHYCYLITGKVEYYWRNHGEDKIQNEAFVAGELFLTGPNIDHQMVFQEDSIMVVVSEFKRDAVSYDADIVKIPPLNENI
jgi:quercetin dioxygenase-like cupin family protein